MQFVVAVYFDPAVPEWVAYSPVPLFKSLSAGRASTKAAAILAFEANVAAAIMADPSTAITDPHRLPGQRTQEYLVRYATPSGIEAPTLTVTTNYPP
jgi:hypothetical protein